MLRHIIASRAVPRQEIVAETGLSLATASNPVSLGAAAIALQGFLVGIGNRL